MLTLSSWRRTSSRRPSIRALVSLAVYIAVQVHMDMYIQRHQLRDGSDQYEGACVYAVCRIG